MNIGDWMHRKGLTAKDLVLVAFAAIPLVGFVGLLMYGLIGSLL